MRGIKHFCLLGLLLLAVPVLAQLTQEISLDVGSVEALASAGDLMYCVDNTTLEMRWFLHNELVFYEHNYSPLAIGTTASDMAINHDRIYLATAAGFQIRLRDNIPNRLDDGDLSGTAYTDLFVVDNTAYLVSEDQLSIVDVTDPQNLPAPTTVAITGLQKITVKGNYVYAACGANNLRIYDRAGTPVGSLDVTGDPWGIAVVGEYAYLASRGTTVAVVVDVSNPALPVEVGTAAYTSGEVTSDVLVEGHWMYFGTSSTTLPICAVDVTDPSSPTLVASSVPAATFQGGIEIAHNHLFVAHTDHITMCSGSSYGLDVALTAPEAQNNTWVLMGIPVITEVNGHPATLFQDDVGLPYGEPNWIMSRWNDDLPDGGGYQRFADYNPEVDEEIANGFGYWFIQTTGGPVTLDIESTQYFNSPYYTVLLGSEFPVGTGEDPAHVMLANPFNHGYNVAEMEFSAGGYRWDAAITSLGLNASVYTWDGSQYHAAEWDTAVLASWQGFWLIRTAGTVPEDIEFPYVAPGKAVSQPKQVASWRLGLGAQTADGAYHDLDNGLGGRENSVAGYDPYDAFEITPPTSKFVILYFSREGKRFAVDYREFEVNDSRQYDLVVWTRNLQGEEIDLRWSNLADLPGGLAFTLLNAQGQPLVDMLSADRFTFTAPNDASGTTQFSVRVERSASAIDPVPKAAAIVSVHPNPFNPATIVTFTLPVTQRVEIAIYDLKGRLVDVVARGEYSQGLHDVRWDAAGHPTGTYLVRLAASDGISTQTITLVK